MVSLNQRPRPQPLQQIALRFFGLRAASCSSRQLPPHCPCYGTCKHLVCGFGNLRRICLALNQISFVLRGLENLAELAPKAAQQGWCTATRSLRTSNNPEFTRLALDRKVTERLVWRAKAASESQRRLRKVVKDITSSKSTS